MEIKTRFNINDTIWTIEQRFNEEKDDFEWVTNSTPRIVKRIVFCADEKEIDITYHTVYLDGSRDICYYDESSCFATKEEAQRECDKRNKSEQDVKDIFDTASDLITTMVINKRKKAVVDNMQDKLKPIIEYLQIVEPKQYQYFSNLCFQEIQKHNSITDKVFYKTTIDFLNSLMLPDKDELPQYKFRTMKQIRDSIVKRLRDELEKM